MSVKTFCETFELLERRFNETMPPKGTDITDNETWKKVNEIVENMEMHTRECPQCTEAMLTMDSEIAPFSELYRELTHHGLPSDTARQLAQKILDATKDS